MIPATVYVTQETDKDFSGAEAWGRIEFLTKDDYNNTRGSLHNEELSNRLKFLLRKYDHERDWIVVSGSPYVAAAVFNILGRMHVNRINILRWDNRDRVYRPMHLDTGRMKSVMDV